MDKPTLWLDSNVARSPRLVRDLTKLAKKKGVRVFVHAHVHLELCRQVRVRTGDEFSQQLIESFVRLHGIDVAEAKLDQAAAEAWAEILSRRYPTDDEWQKAKARSVRARLPEGASSSAKHVPMTTDWLVALEVEQRGSYVAVEDKGEEWSGLRAMSPRRALSYDETLQWLSEQPDAQP